MKQVSRREFLKCSITVGGAMALPTIVPGTVFGQSTPSNRIQIAQIGCGRIANEMDMPGILKHYQLARIVAVCDLDSKRLAKAKDRVEKYYASKGATVSVKAFGDYREMLKSGG